MDPLVAAGLHQTFTTATTWRLRARQVANDVKLNKFKLEADRRQPTLCPFLSIRTLAEGRRGSGPKKRKFGDASVVFAEDEHEEVHDSGRFALSEFEKWCAAGSVVANTWALTGQNTVSFGGKQVKWCTWQEACEYIERSQFEAKALIRQFGEECVMASFIAIGEEIRVEAISLVRGNDSVMVSQGSSGSISSDGLPRGMALMEAFRAHRHRWMDERTLLSSQLMSSRAVLPRSAAGGPPQHSAAAMPVKQELGTQRTVQATSAVSKGGKSWSTAKQTKDGKEICKAFNDQRTCSSPCAQGKTHVCDIVLDKTKQACGKAHTRLQHNESSDGKGARRE